MLRRSNYVLIMLVIALLGWSAATDIAAQLLTGLEPSTLPYIARLTGRSGTLAIIGAAATLVAIPLLVSGLRKLLIGGGLRWRKALAGQDAEIPDFDVLWDQLAATYALTASLQPRQALEYSEDEHLARIDGRTLLLRRDIVSGLRGGRARRPDAYDFACFVVLHELGHLRSGDARLYRVRDTLAATLAGLLAASLVLSNLAPNEPMFLVAAWPALLVIGLGLWAVLRQISREIEKAADAWALDQVIEKQGIEAATRVVARFDKLRPGERPIGIPASLMPYPAPARRLSALRLRVHLWPFTLLWIAALAILTYTQQNRIDASCNDCDMLYQAWFDLLAVITIIALTVLSVSFLSVPTSGTWGSRLWKRAGSVVLATSGYLLVRLWLHWDGLPGWIEANGLGIAIKGLFLSTDLYTWLVVGHLAIAAIVAAWPRHSAPILRHGIPQPESDSSGRTFADRLRVWCLQEVPAAIYHAGRGISLTLAVMLSVAVVGMVAHAVVTPSAPALASNTGLWITLCGALASFAAYWVPFWGAIALEGVSLALVLLVWTFLMNVVQIVIVQAGLNPSSPEAQIAFGTLMKDHLAALFAIKGVQERALWATIPALPLIAVVGVWTALRLQGLNLVFPKAATEGAGA